MACIRALRRCSLFENLAYRDLGVLAHFVKEDTADAGGWVLPDGAKRRTLVILDSGRVRLLPKQGGLAAVDLGPGDFFGELSIVPGRRPQAVSAKALESCVFIRLDAEAFDRLTSHNPDVASRVASAVLSALAERLAQAGPFMAGN